MVEIGKLLKLVRYQFFFSSTPELHWQFKNSYICGFLLTCVYVECKKGHISIVQRPHLSTE